MNKFGIYRFVAPFRSRLQSRIRKRRLNVNFEVFASDIEGGVRSKEIALYLWEGLREEAFVEDFRPAADDSLSKLYGMGPEEIRDELTGQIADRLGLDIGKVDFEGFDFSAIDTPRAVAELLMAIDDTGRPINRSLSPRR